MKLIAPNNEEIEVKCKAKIAKSTLGPEWAWIEDNGGYQILYIYIYIKNIIIIINIRLNYFEILVIN